MKRLLLWLVPLLVLALFGLWLAGKAPGRYVLEQECLRYHEERKVRDRLLREEIARATLDQPSLAPRPLETRLKHLSFLREHRTLRMRGWEVLLIPPGAPLPAPDGFLDVGEFDPSGPRDHRNVRGAMEIWIAPRGPLARLLAGLGLTP